MDLPLEYQTHKGEIDAAMQAVLQRGDFIKGESVKQFEKAFANYLGVSNVVSCGNGTDALQLALMALGIGENDEVILPAFSYVAAIEAVSLLKAKPVLVDIDMKYFQIDTDNLKQKITSQTKAIIAVHLFGQCADIDVLADIAKQHHLYLIEDCAQSIGTTYSGKHLGTFGAIACTSFFPTKNLSCYGDGGALYTNDDDLAKKVRMLAAHGQSEKYRHHIVGVNSRLDSLHAALLNVKLNYLEKYLARKKEIVTLYKEQLDSLQDIQLPLIYRTVNHSWHQFTILVQHGKRDELRKYLKDHGIDSMVYYPLVLNQQEAYKHIVGYCPNSDSLIDKVLSLPIHPYLKNHEVSYICEIIHKFYGG